MNEQFKLCTLRPGFTKSPRPSPLHVEISSRVVTPSSRSILQKDGTVILQNKVNYIDANKQERR